jgi:hypothetical protein
MKRTIISKVSDMLADEVLTDVGEDLLSIDPDTIDSIVQKAIDTIETQVYEKTLNKINVEWESHRMHLDKWW